MLLFSVCFSPQDYDKRTFSSEIMRKESISCALLKIFVFTVNSRSRMIHFSSPTSLNVTDWLQLFTADSPGEKSIVYLPLPIRHRLLGGCLEYWGRQVNKSAYSLRFPFPFFFCVCVCVCVYICCYFLFLFVGD